MSGSPLPSASPLAMLMPTTSDPASPRPARHGDRVDLGQGQVRRGQCLLDDSIDRLDVLARGDLGEDAAVLRVQVDLRGDQAGLQRAPVLDDRRGGLIAGGFNPQNARWGKGRMIGFFHVLS